MNRYYCKPQVRKFTKAYRVRVDPHMQFVTQKLPQKTEYELYSQKVIKKLKSKSLTFYREDFDDIDTEWLSIFTNLRMLRVQRLSFDSAYTSSLLIHLIQIKFTNLTHLNLSTNVIFSIEPIKHINMPYLEQLDLSDNNISNGQVLGYANLPRLKKIALENNEMREIGFLKHMNSKVLQVIKLEMDLYSNNQSVSVRDLFWLNGGCPIKEICIQNRTARVEEPQKMALLKEKFILIKKQIA